MESCALEFLNRTQVCLPVCRLGTKAASLSQETDRQSVCSWFSYSNSTTLECDLRELVFSLCSGVN